MPHLLHIDSSIQGPASISRRLTARAARAWRAAHPGGTVHYRDLGADPLPHLDDAGGTARIVAPDEHTPAQAESYALSLALVREIEEADTVLLGLPLYNYGPPSVVKAWVDHIIIPGVTFDPETLQGKFGNKEFIVLASRGGGYGEGTPRHGWDHAEPWLPHAVSPTGLEPRFVVAELTMAHVNPAMSELRHLAEASLAAAEASIDNLWPSLSAAA